MIQNAENYKGIDFIRVSKLPEDQRNLIVKTISADQIIKILKEKELIVDCIQYEHYMVWYKHMYQTKAEGEKRPFIEKEAVEVVKVA